MRPLVAVILATIVLGSVSLFIKSQARVVVPRSVHESKTSTGHFSVEITLTFDAGPDAFALSDSDAPSLLVQHLGRSILKRTDEIPAGTPIIVPDVTQIEAGKNSFVIRCTPRDNEVNVARAIRVRILRDGEPIADQSIWSRPGEPCEGVVEVDVQGERGVSEAGGSEAGGSEAGGSEAGGSEASGISH